MNVARGLPRLYLQNANCFVVVNKLFLVLLVVLYCMQVCPVERGTTSCPNRIYILNYTTSTNSKFSGHSHFDCFYSKFTQKFLLKNSRSTCLYRLCKKSLRQIWRGHSFFLTIEWTLPEVCQDYIYRMQIVLLLLTNCF